MDRENKIQDLLDMLKNPDALLQDYAARELVNLGDQTVEYLIPLLKASEDSTKLNAIWILGKVGGVEVVPHLVNLLKDSNEYIQMQAAEALGELAEPLAVDHLLATLDDSLLVSMKAVTALGKIGDQRAVPSLIERLLVEVDFRMVSNLAVALADLKAVEAIPIMQKIHLSILDEGAIGGFLSKDAFEQLQNAIDALQAQAEQLAIQSVSTEFNNDQTQENQRSVFLSYARKDAREIVERLAVDLEQEGFQVWWDKQITPGMDWANAIEQAIKQVSTMIAILTPASVHADFVKKEWQYALNQKNIPIIPVLALGFSEAEIPIVLISIQWIDFNGNYHSALEQLSKTLNT